MMNGHERSGSVIVAAKPANKAAYPAVEQSMLGPAAAELGEPRTEAEGNADQQSTCRAQNRISVAQALERIRKVARERKKERFTALFHHISTELLEEAFPRTQGGRSTRRGSADMEGLRGRPRAQARGLARSGPTGSVPGVAEPASLHTQAGRTSAPARGCRAGGQDRPTGGGHAAERDLRGGLPRHLVWVPTGARHA